MEFKDYYATLGVARTATQDEVKRAYRKLARKYHPDVSKEADAETRFKEVAEAHEALIDPERRAAYDDLSQRRTSGQPFEPPPGWDSGYEFSGRGANTRPAGGEADFSEFFESLFGRSSASGGAARPPHRRSGEPFHAPGDDHHAQVVIDLRDAYLGARRSLSLRVPVIDARGQATVHDRRLEVAIPKGVREGQHLRLVGQGGAGHGDGPAGDLYLEVRFQPHPLFRVEGRDVYVDVPVTPSEAALGAMVGVPLPDGEVQVNIPAGSAAGRKLRLKAKGLPGAAPGDVYVVLSIALPPATSEAAQAAYRALADAAADFDPRGAWRADHA